MSQHDYLFSLTHSSRFLFKHTKSALVKPEKKWYPVKINGKMIKILCRHVLLFPSTVHTNENIETELFLCSYPLRMISIHHRNLLSRCEPGITGTCWYNSRAQVGSMIYEKKIYNFFHIYEMWRLHHFLKSAQRWRDSFVS